LFTEDRPVSPSKGYGSHLPSVEAGKKRAFIDSTGDLKWTPQKERLLNAIEEEEKQEKRVKFFSSFDEAKFAATGILSQLSKLILDGTFREETDLPFELKADLQQGFGQLTEDVVVEKREWQTDCYLDWVRENRNPFFESRPEEEALCSAVEYTVDKFVAKQKKRVTMAEGKNPERGKSPSLHGWKGSSSRPVSSLSIHSETLGSEFMYGEFGDEKDEGFDYLPPGLGVPAPTTPSLLKPPAESRTPTYNMKSQTRIEKRAKMEAEAKKIQVSRKKKVVLEEKPTIEEEEVQEEGKTSPVASQLIKDQGLIKFAMSNTDFEECGWIVKPDDKHDPEGVTLLKWIQARLKEVVKQKKEDQFAAKLRGEDGPLVQRYYSDPHKTYHRSRVQPSYLTIPLPPGIKPGATAMRLSIPSEEIEPLDQRKKSIVLLPDGTGTIYYPSGRPAVVMSRKGDGTKGLNVFVFSNSTPQYMLSYFKPDGVFCCYYPDGGLQLLTTHKGGTLYDKDGDNVRQWVWPNPQYKLPQSIVVTLNENISFRCTCLSSATLYFTNGTLTHKVSVSPPLENLGEDNNNVEEGYTLKTKAPFSSTTAHTMLPVELTTKKGNKRKQSILSKSTELDSSVIDGNDKYNVDLTALKTKVKCIVEEWMDFYRKKLGIRTRTPSPLALSRSTTYTSNPTSRLQSSKSLSRPHSHTRHQTYPQPSSRPETQLSVASQHGPRYSPSPEPLPGSSIGLVYERPHTRAKAHTVQYPLTITADVSEIGRKRWKVGCPVALRTKILHRLSNLPSCKCDKRRIPRITDVEYDKYMQTHVPRNQLVVVIITDSTSSSKQHPLLDILQKLNTRMNRNKSSPCEMSSQDPYRFVVYDTSTAAQNTNNSTPLLVSRHVVTPGIALMYVAGKLVFAGDRFNGYGISLKDFHREVRTRL
jgi:hypothetical protein